MYPPIYTTITADAGSIALLGNPPRFYPFGEAPQNVTKPYAVWQTVGGAPYNCIDTVPNTDDYAIQVDVYAPTASAAWSVAEAMRDALESNAHITRWGGDVRDPTTNNYRVSFDLDWILNR